MCPAPLLALLAAAVSPVADGGAPAGPAPCWTHEARTLARAALGARDDATRLKHLGALQRYSSFSAPAIPELAVLAAEGSPSVRLQALTLMTRMRQPGAEARAVIRNIVRSGDAASRVAAIGAMGRGDEMTADDVSALGAALSFGDDQVREAARSRLASARDTSAALEPALAEFSRSPAALAPVLGRSRSQRAVDPLLGLLGDSKDEPGRAAALEALADLAAHVQPDSFAPALVPLLRDESPTIRREAAVVLARTGESERALRVLSRLVAARDQQALWAIQNLGPRAVAALPTLVRIAAEPIQTRFFHTDGGGESWGPDEEQERLRESVRHWLPSLGDKSVPLLVVQLGRPALGVGTLETLRELGPLAAIATPNIARLLSSSNAVLRLAAAHALEGIGPRASAAVPALMNALHDREEAVVIAAAEALAAVGPAAARAAPALAKLLPRSAPVAEAAAEALARIGTGSRAVGASLIRAATCARGRTLGTIAFALVKTRVLPQWGVATLVRGLDPAAAAALPRELGSSKWEDFSGVEEGQQARFNDREWAVGRLGALAEEPEARLALPALVAVVSSDTREEVAAAATAIGRFGTAARSAVTALAAAATRKNPWSLDSSRSAVYKSIVAIEGREAVPLLVSRLGEHPEAAHGLRQLVDHDPGAAEVVRAAARDLCLPPGSSTAFSLIGMGILPWPTPEP